MGRNVKCRATHCLHDSNILPIEEAVKSGTAYYHPDCLKAKELSNKVFALFVEQVNANVIHKVLWSVINTIVYERNIDPEYLLYGLKYYIYKKIPLNYPQGLYYVIQNREVQAGWNKIKAKDKSASFEIKEEKPHSFSYTPQKKKGIADIFG
jgi:hypothetical protein